MSARASSGPGPLHGGAGIFHAVQDASSTGGGMAEVALALLREHGRHVASARLLCARIDQVHDALVTRAGAMSAGSVVHLHGLWTPFDVSTALRARLRGARVVFSPHGALLPWAFTRSKALKKRLAWTLCHRWVLNAADLVVANSAEEERALRRLGISAPIALLPNGVDMTHYPGADPGSDATLGERPYVLYLGRLSPIKGIPDLIDAWHRLGDPSGHRLVIRGYGADDYRQQLVEQVARLGIGGSVEIGPPAFGVDKWRLLQGASVYVLASHGESFGITVAEALMAGTPVIATHATPWSAIGEQGLGWLVDNHADEISAAIGQALALGLAERAAMGARCRDYAAVSFQWAPIALQYLAAYRWLLNKDGARPDWVHLS